MTMPETTPMPKEIAKILVQNPEILKYASRPVARYSPSRTTIQLARPIVKAGNRMWKETMNANWIRDRKSGSYSIAGGPLHYYCALLWPVFLEPGPRPGGLGFMLVPDSAQYMCWPPLI